MDRWKENPYGYSAKAFEYKMDFTDILSKVVTTDYQNNHTKKKFKEKFTILTYNVWGVEVFKFTFIDIRLPFIINLLKENKNDIICLQEVSQKILKTLLADPWVVQNYYFSETDINWDNRADVISLTLSKVQPIKTYIYTLKGGLFPSDIVYMEFDDRVIINTSLHPGSKSSPGISDSSNYSLCRIEQITIIEKIIDKLNTKNKTIYLCGDFNIDFNGPTDDWPELNKIKELKLNDTWKLLKKDDNGFTEDTTLNTMRWNTKQIEKQVRFDAILYTPNQSTTALSIQIVGTKKVYDLPFEMFTEHSKHLKLNPKKGFRTGDKIYYDDQPKTLDWYPSDHFGVVATFSQIASTE